jgi:hypothetical protein
VQLMELRHKLGQKAIKERTFIKNQRKPQIKEAFFQKK